MEGLSPFRIAILRLYGGSHREYRKNETGKVLCGGPPMILDTYLHTSEYSPDNFLGDADHVDASRQDRLEIGQLLAHPRCGRDELRDRKSVV